MKEGDKVIWDSHWYFEIAFFKKYSEMFDATKVEITFDTGCIRGSVGLVNKNDVFPYTEELRRKMELKYNPVYYIPK